MAPSKASSGMSDLADCAAGAGADGIDCSKVRTEVSRASNEAVVLDAVFEFGLAVSVAEGFVSELGGGRLDRRQHRHPSFGGGLGQRSIYEV